MGWSGWDKFVPNMPAVPKAHKYSAKKASVDGLVFDSTKEARRYSDLKIMETAGLIRELQHHTRWPLPVNGIVVAHFEPDFEYFDANGIRVVEDVKSKATRTPLYVLKAKLMQAIYHITIQEV